MKSFLSFLKTKNKQLLTSLMFLFVLSGAFYVASGHAYKLFGMVSDPEPVGAGGTPRELCGFAWGATSEIPASTAGIGWVSFNRQDCDEAADGVGCPMPGVDYQVTDTDGNLEGYAWSSNLGWIKFGGLASFPLVAGDTVQQPINARINADGTLTGWARACAGTVGGDCSSMNSRIDGWDGWISLRGNASGNSYGVTMDDPTQDFHGYSWGGNVVGWLKWDPSSGSGVKYCAPPGLIATLSTNDPTTGPAPLDVDLEATSEIAMGAQKNLAQAGGVTEYRFNCDVNSLGWGAWDTDNTYACYGVYTIAGRTYTPTVEVRRTGYTPGSDSLTVTTDQINPLNVSCNIVSENDTLNIDEEADWIANIGTPGIAPYTYTFEFDEDDDGNFDDHQVIHTGNQLSRTVERSFGRVGNKAVRVSVRDSSVPVKTGLCEENIGVIVRPNFIER